MGSTWPRGTGGRAVAGVKRKIDAMHAEYGLSSAGRCAECCNFVHGRYHDRCYNKCVAYGLSHSEATDWRAKYLACGLFNRPFDQIRPKRRPLVEVFRAKEAKLGPMDGQISM